MKPHFDVLWEKAVTANDETAQRAISIAWQQVNTLADCASRAEIIARESVTLAAEMTSQRDLIAQDLIQTVNKLKKHQEDFNEIEDHIRRGDRTNDLAERALETAEETLMEKIVFHGGMYIENLADECQASPIDADSADLAAVINFLLYGDDSISDDTHAKVADIVTDLANELREERFKTSSWKRRLNATRRELANKDDE